MHFCNNNMRPFMPVYILCKARWCLPYDCRSGVHHHIIIIKSVFAVATVSLREQLALTPAYTASLQLLFCVVYSTGFCCWLFNAAAPGRSLCLAAFRSAPGRSLCLAAFRSAPGRSLCLAAFRSAAGRRQWYRGGQIE